MKRADRKKDDWDWSTYFAIKVRKLEEQFAKEQEHLGPDERIFTNVGIYVLGFTNPTSIELKDMMMKHGGVFYEYLNDRVNYVISSNLAHSKAVMFKNKTIVKPEWIVDCIKMKKLLPIESYILQTSISDKMQNKLTSYMIQGDNKTPDVKRCLKRKSFTRVSTSGSDRPIFIDLTRSPKRSPQAAEMPFYQDYLTFEQRLKDLEISSRLRSKYKHELEIKTESIKFLLNDWVYITSLNASSQRSQIDADDLSIFKSYLIHLVRVEKNLELVRVVLKLLKRIIEKNGSYEWIEAYDDLYSSIQTEFFEKYDSVLRLD